MNKFLTMVLWGLSMMKPKSNVKIDIRPVVSKKESFEISKQKLKRTRGKKPEEIEDEREIK